MIREQLVNTVRWLAIFPVAAIAVILVQFPLHLVLYQTLTGSGIVEPYPDAPERLLSPLVAALAFIWAGSRLAPNRKMAVAITLFSIWLCGTGASLALALTGAQFGNVGYSVRLGGVPVVFSIVGAFLGLLVAHSENSATKADQSI